MAEAPASPDPESTLRSRAFVAVLVLAAVVGVIASVAAWCFLELDLLHAEWVFTDIPKDLGFDHGPPLWWYLPVLAFAGVVAAFAIARLPGNGGHIPAEGLKASPTQPVDLPGVLLAAVASIGLGLVVGPEAPLIALGGGLGFLTVRSIRRDAPPQLGMLLASSGTFAAVSFLFGSPIIAAVILIEAAGLGGSRMPLVLIPGLLAAGIGSLVSIGMGSLTGLSTSDISLSPLNLPAFARPDLVDFLWTIPFAAVIAVVTFADLSPRPRGPAHRDAATVRLPPAGRIARRRARDRVLSDDRPRRQTRCCSRVRTRSAHWSRTPAPGPCRRSRC